MEDPSTLQIFFDYYSITKPPLSKEVSCLYGFNPFFLTILFPQIVGSNYPCSLELTLIYFDSNLGLESFVNQKLASG